MTVAEQISARVPQFRVLFDSLPNPVIVLDGDDRVVLVNSATEDYFQTGKSGLLRMSLSELVPFSSPVLQSVKQVRDTGGAVNEYAVGMGTPRLGGERMVDIQTSPVSDEPDFVLLVVLRRSMAQKFDLQLSHQGAARSVSGMASMLPMKSRTRCPAFAVPHSCWSRHSASQTDHWRG